MNGKQESEQPVSPSGPESPARAEDSLYTALLTAKSYTEIEEFRSSHKTKVLTILFSDLVGSTRQQNKLGNPRAAELVQRHRLVFREVLKRFDGQVVETAGDSFLIIFSMPSEGVKFALHMQAAMRRVQQDDPELPAVRVGIHQGQVVVERHDTGPKPMDIYGLQVSAAARIMDLAQGAQILCSRAVFDDARAILRSEDFKGLGTVAWRNHGPYRFKGVDDLYDVCEVGEEGVAPLTPPLAGAKGWPAGHGTEELGWRPAAGVAVPGTNWVLEERLGKEEDEKDVRRKFRGEFGEVWKAWNASQKSHEVFKFCFKRDRVPVLKREARLLKRLQKHRHPNLVEVYDVTEGDRPPYYLEMEYVEGPTLEEWLATNPPLNERLEIAAQVADALDTVHAAGIYHRDIKPSNILLTRRGDGALQAKLTDFGLGAAEDQDLLKSIQASCVEGVAGTWDYIAPELRKGGKTSPQSDLYSLGLALFQIVTGDVTTPAGPGWESCIESEVLRQDIARCMDSDPKKRWRGAAELATALRSHDARLQRLQLEREEQVRRLRAKRLQRNTMLTAALILAVLSVIFGAIVLWQIQQKRFARQHELDARTAEAKARHAASETDFALAVDEMQKNNMRVALAYLADALRKDPSNEKATALAVSVLRNCPLPAITVRHHDEVHSANFSPDGTRIVTASADGTARLWDARSGQPIGMQMRHEEGEWVHSAVFSPDGNWIVTASWDGTARVWDAHTAQARFKLQHDEPVVMKHNDRVTAANFSPDGRWVVTACFDHRARIWDAQTGEQLRDPQTHELVDLPHGGIVWTANFSPDGQRVVTASADKTARVWDAQTGHPVINPRNGQVISMSHHDEVNVGGFSPDGRWIVTGSDDGYAKVWDAQTGEALTNPRDGKPLEMRHTGAVISVSFSPNSRWIVTASGDKSVQVWDVQTSKAIGQPMRHEGWVRIAHFSPDGRLVVTASYDGTARVWDTQTGKPVSNPMYHGGAVYDANFSPDGKCLVTASFDHSARVWIAQKDKVSKPMNHKDRVESASFSRDGNWVVTASRDMTACVWDAHTGEARINPQSGKPVVMQHPDTATVTTASFSPDGKWVLTASSDGCARFWDAQTGGMFWQTAKLNAAPHSNEGNIAAISNDGRWIVTAYADGTVRLWDAKTGEAVTHPKNGQPVQLNLKCKFRTVVFAPDGKSVLTASADGTARILDTRTGDVLRELRHKGGVESARYSVDGKWIVTASDDHSARIWNAQTGKQVAEPMYHDGWVYDAEFSPNGQLVVTASTDGTARIWDRKTERPVPKLMQHGDTVKSATFSPNGQWVVTASADGTARIWFARTGLPVSAPLRHWGEVTAASFSHDGKWVLTASADQTARIWEVPITKELAPDWLIELIEDVGGLRLDEHGDLRQVENDLADFRKLFSGLADSDELTHFGRWLVADPTMRTLSPLLQMTVPEFVSRRLQENTEQSAEEAYDADPGNPVVLATLAKFKIKSDQEEALFYCRLALRRVRSAGSQEQIVRVLAIAKSLFPDSSEFRGDPGPAPRAP